MKRHYLIFLILVVAGFFLLNPQIPAESAEKESIPKGDIVTTEGPFAYTTFKGSPQNSIVVNFWSPSAAVKAAVEYGTTTSYGSTISTSTASNFHHIELTGLTPGTTYHYRVNKGPDQTFKTESAVPTKFKFAVTGDNRDDPSNNSVYAPRHKQLYDFIGTQNIDFMLNTGDLINYGNSIEQYKTYFYCEQQMNRMCPNMISMGNHEVQNDGMGEHYYFFDLYSPGFPTNGTPGSEGRNYSFNYGNAHFVCLSSYQMSIASENEWLAADLAAAKANPNIKWLFAFMHWPLYSGGPKGSNGNLMGHSSLFHGTDNERDHWSPIFDTYKVDIVFGGHNHLYERTYPIVNQVAQKTPGATGTIYTTIGLGGGPMNIVGPASDTVNYPDAQYDAVWYDNNSPGGCKTSAIFVTIDGNKLTFKLLSNDGVEHDSLTINKTPKLKKKAM